MRRTQAFLALASVVLAVLMTGCARSAPATPPVPTATQAAPTPEPAAVSTPVAPSPTPIPATATFVPTDTPAPPTTTPTATTSTVTPPVAQGFFSKYGVTLTNDGGWMTVAAAYEDTFTDVGQIGTDETLLQVVIDLWKEFSDEELGPFEGGVLLVDGEGHEYKPKVQTTFGQSMTLSRSGDTLSVVPEGHGYSFGFVVPRDTDRFTLHVGDFPPFDLGYPLTPAATPTSQGSAPSPATGSVQGMLVGSDSNQPRADAYILLCEVVDPAASERECLLRAGLATVTGPDGRFEFASVPTGTYVMVYGLPDEVKDDPQTWDSLLVDTSPYTMDALDNGIDPFGGSKGVKVNAGTTVDITGDGIFVNTGSFTSLEFGLSIEYRQREPLTVSVIAGQPAEVTVEVTGH